MNFLAKLFSRNKTKIQEEEFSPYKGGDGLSKDSPVFINCASIGMANFLIDRFISEKHGVKNSDWNQTMSMTLKSKITECGMVKSIVINSANESYTYYFDISRPFKNPINRIL